MSTTTTFTVGRRETSDGRFRRYLLIPRRRSEAALLVDDLLESARVRVIPQSRASFLAGLALYKLRFDKSYSLTDCISMQTMRQEGLTEALTNDRHFEQEGFHAVFRR